MHSIYRLLFTIVTLIFLQACDNSNNSSPTNELSVAEKHFVSNLFSTEYLWANQVTTNVNLTQAHTPSTLIDALKVTPPDYWSFAITAQAYEDRVNQQTSGFGFRYRYADFTILQTRINSPAYQKLLRGDRLLKINGETITSERLTTASQNLNRPTTFTLLRANQEITLSVTPQYYQFKVTLGKLLTHQNRTIGYLRYDAFNSTSIAEFEAEFTKFKQADIQELIIDLRYNGGGSIAVASTLLENITNAYPNQRQVYLDWNNNYKHRNNTYYFTDEIEANDLAMQRVFFLVTKSAASASELVISALKPYLGESNVITIGTATHGKNVGMVGRSYHNNYYFLINFVVRNHAGETTPTKGISPTCSADDDLTHLLGDPQETLLKSALFYIEHEACP